MSLFLGTCECSKRSSHCTRNVHGTGKVKVSVAPPVYTLWINRLWRYNSTDSYLGTRWSWVISYTPPPLCCRGVTLQQAFKKRPKTPWNHSGHCGVDKVFLCRESNCSLLAMPTEPAQCSFLFADRLWLIWAARRDTLPIHLSNDESVIIISSSIIVVVVIIGPSALGWPWPPQANVASDLYPGHPPANFYNPVSFRLPLPRQSILISVGHVLVDLQGLSSIFLSNSLSTIRAVSYQGLDCSLRTSLDVFIPYGVEGKCHGKLISCAYNLLITNR